MLVSTRRVVPSATPGPGASVKRSSSSMRPKGCVGSSPLSFDNSASLEPAENRTRGAKRSGNRGAPRKIKDRLSDWPCTNPHETENRFRHGFATHLIVARFPQKFSRLLLPPKSVVKLVESTKTISPARCSFGGIQRRQLSSVLPATVNGCGRSRSIG
jgi:hypothetical protein